MVDSCDWHIWRPTSKALLRKAEENMLKGADCEYEGSFVELPEKSRIRTIKFGNHNNPEKIPLVLMHGFGAGLGFFILNYKYLSQKRNVYAIDLLGFGRSSRPKFPNDPIETENMFVESIEQWRINMGLEKVNLLGHSFGGYISALYALKYPDNLNHLILADPWGFPELPDPEEFGLSPWKLALLKKISNMNVFSFLRAAGPLGPSLVRKLRGDIPLKFQHVFGEDDTAVSNYIYHCNALDPSGETAFTNISQYLGYSKNPLINRIKDIDKNLPITVLYGKDSWVADLFYFPCLKSELSDHRYCSIKIIYDAGHHIYCDNYKDFNRHVNGACSVKVSSKDFPCDMHSVQPSEAIEYSDAMQLITPI